MRITRTPLRISFAGGGSDLPAHFEEHEGAVCSITIDKYIYITAKPNVSLFPHRYRLMYSRVEELSDRDQIAHPIIRQLVADYGIGALDLSVMSDIPAGTGMGSSSAFTVGLHNALSRLPYDKHRLAHEACATEILDLGEPIGYQDQYAAAFGGLNHFHFTDDGVTVSPLMLPPEGFRALKASLTLVYLGGTRSASTLLKEQSSNDNTHNLRAMTALATNAAMALRRGNIVDLGPIIREGWERKRGLSAHVSTDLVDHIISQASRHGATGAKLLGAGGAGFILIFCPPNEHGKMIEGLRPLNLQYVDFGWDFEGSKILYE